MIKFTKTLIITDITKSESNNCLLYIVLKKIMANTLSHRTRFDTALGNHALRAQPIEYPLIAS